MKKFLLIAAMAAMAIGASADGYKIERVWDDGGTVSSFYVTGDMRQGFGMDGKFYINDKTAQTVYIFDENGLAGELPGGANCGISRDQAGNVIVSNAAFPGSWVEATIKVINPTTGDVKEYVVPEECGLIGRCDFLGFAKGDLMENGALYLTGKTNADIYTDGISIFTVTDGEVDFDNCYLATCPSVGALHRDNMTVLNYYDDVNGDPAVLYVYRSMGGNVVKMTYDGDNFAGTVFTPPVKGACNGSFVFIWDNKEFILYPQLPNYLNGFAIAELGATEAIVTVPPTVTTAPNGFQSNWLNAEVDADGVTIYQYNPGYMMVVWRLTKDEPAGMRGDINIDNAVNISDVTTLINYLLSGDATGLSVDNADCNLDEAVNITDVTTLINFLLKGNWPE